MAEERKTSGRHTVTLERRENAIVTGVTDVISFDEESIIAETEMGVLILHGTNLHVSRLNLDEGDLEVDGEIDNLTYENDNRYGKGKSSFLNKLFK